MRKRLPDQQIERCLGASLKIGLRAQVVDEIGHDFASQ
jgi:hypothetical protein